MRVISEINHPLCKITFYSWNNRYLIKLEKDFLEQTFKINQFDIASEHELSKIVNDSFIQEALTRFDSMHFSLGKALTNL